MYATIWYDTNDTGYRTDPNGTTRHNFIHSNNHYIQPGHMLYSDPGGWTGEYNKLQWHSSHLYAQMIQNGYFIMRYGSDGLESHQFARDGNHWTRYLGWLSNWANQNVRTDSNPTFGNIYSNGWFRNNNSGQGLYAQSRDMHWYSNNGYWKSAGGSYGYGGVLMYNTYEGDLRGYSGYYDGSGFGMLNSSGNWQIRIEYGNAHMELYRITYMNDARAYIYYDRNDTGYYMDPNGTSNFAYITDRARASVGNSGMYNTPRWAFTGDTRYWTGAMGWGTTDFNVIRSNWSGGNFDTWSWPGNRPNDTSSHWVGDQAYHFSHRDSFNAYGYQLAYSGENGNNRLYIRGGWPGPRGWNEMLHSGNYSEYYSFGNGLYSLWWEPYGVGGNSGNGAHAYRIFQEGGGWGFPYPDLRIAFHTGIKMGANAGSYEGIRIYDDYPMGSILIQLTGSSNYSFWYTWQNLTGYHGIYSGLNSAHFYPNNGSYGSWRIDGTRNGWAGIEFNANGAGNVSLMMNSSESGMHNNSYGWHFLRSNGTAYVGKGYWGGSNATILDSSNQPYAWNMNQYVRTGDEPRFNSHWFYTDSFSRYTGLRLFRGEAYGVWEVRSDFGGISGSESGGIGINGTGMTFWTPGDRTEAFTFQDEDSIADSFYAYISTSGILVRSDANSKFSIRHKVSENYEYLDRLMQLRPVTYALKYELLDTDTPEKRKRKISKMLEVHQGLVAQEVKEIFPSVVENGAIKRRIDFEVNDETTPILESVGITSLNEVNEVSSSYTEYVSENEGYAINYQALNTYTILAIQDFKKMHDEQVATLQAQIETLQNQINTLVSGSNP
jgi:hypothetical protein